MAGITAEQGDRIIALLEQLTQTTAASALVIEAMHARAEQPHLARQHLALQQAAWQQGLATEVEARKVRQQLQHAKLPRLWASTTGGIPAVRAEPPAPLPPEGDDP